MFFWKKNFTSQLRSLQHCYIQKNFWNIDFSHWGNRLPLIAVFLDFSSLCSVHTKSSRPFILYYIVNVIEDCKIGTLRLLRIIYDVLRIGILAQKVCIYIRFLTKFVDDSKDFVLASRMLFLNQYVLQ